MKLRADILQSRLDIEELEAVRAFELFWRNSDLWSQGTTPPDGPRDATTKDDIVCYEEVSGGSSLPQLTGRSVSALIDGKRIR